MQKSLKNGSQSKTKENEMKSQTMKICIESYSYWYSTETSLPCWRRDNVGWGDEVKGVC